MPSKDSRITIVGGGVFGLTTALWMARDGYKDITIYDRCAFDSNYYDPANGCDGASSDVNKLFRVAYGDRQDYQNLAIEARDIWIAWDKDIKEGDPSKLPAGLTPEDQLLHFCGCYFLSDGKGIQGENADSLATMQKHAPEVRKMQFVKDDLADEERLRNIDPKWIEKLHLLDNLNCGNTNGFLDIVAGITVADKSCVYARHLCVKAGVKFVLGDPKGKLESLITESNGTEKQVVGIRTADGKKHMADLVIVCAGGWTASLVPEAHRTIETTAGTVMFVDIPKHRQDLWKKFHYDNYPSWSYWTDTGYCGGGYPISKEGRLKFNWRSVKYTNFEDHPTQPGLRVSTPRTKYTKNPINTVPEYGLECIKKVVGDTFPELKQFGFTSSRLCWYTDTIDEHYLVDYVPGYGKSLFIASGGCGHAFKFLPILGRHIKNQIEGIADQFTPVWKWRVVEEGKYDNGLLEGENGPRNLSNVHLASPIDFSIEVQSTSTSSCDV